MDDDRQVLDLLAEIPSYDSYRTEIAGDDFEAGVKILSITGHDSKESQLKTLKAGADAYLEKPVDREQLVQSIEALLDGKTRP